MIEIVGIGCRFPGGIGTPGALIDLLRTKNTSIGPMPEARWQSHEFVARQGDSKAGKSVTNRAGWLEQIDRFDNSFFHLSPREAREMDPQQRLMLEVALEAIFDAQMHPRWLQERKTGVFVGAGFAEFQGMSFGNPEEMTQHSMLGTSLSIIANRLSYFLDLKGPSMTIDTACSSAMTAFHVACQSLRSGQCDVAVVGGINTMLGPSPFIGYTQASMLSPTGTCSPFDASANGFVRGEGCGVVVLRRAEPDSDIPHRRVYAYVRADGIGEDGRTASMTMPSGASQERLMQEVVRSAEVALEDIVYVEAHGTGTPVGDPIEAGSIARAHRGERTRPLAIGSVKGHLGHLETAAGIAGVIKGALCLYHNTLVPTAGFSRWSEQIDADALQLRIPVAVEPLPATQTGDSPLIGVCSYGFGGANAYVLLQQAHRKGESDLSPFVEEDAAPVTQPRAFALPLSAHYSEGLEALENAWKALPQPERKEAALWSAQTRQSLHHRKVWVGLEENLFSLAKPLAGEHVGGAPPVVFFFGGQGSQYPHMGRLLYEQHPVFREAIHRTDACFAEVSGYSLIEQYGLCQREMDPEALRDVTVALPCIVICQVALCTLLKEMNIRPDAVVGHSTGEMVAGWVAGSYDLEMLCRLTHIRASMQAKMQPGAMLAWYQNEADTKALLERLQVQDRVVIASVNAEEAVTLSGDIDAVHAVAAWGEESGVRNILLEVPRAYHSHHVDAIAAELRERLQSIEACPPNIPFVSSVEGREGTLVTEPLDAAYWFDNIRKPVRFASACRAAGAKGKVGLEVSPHRVLSGYVNRTLRMPMVSCLNQRQDDDLSLLQAIGELFVLGVEVRWEGWAKPSRFAKIPSLVWKHTSSYRSAAWTMPASSTATSPAVEAPVGWEQVPRSSSEIMLTPQAHFYFQDHILGKQVIMPGAGYIAELMEATGSSSLQNVQFHRMLSLWKGEAVTRLRIEKDGERISLKQGEQVYFSANLSEQSEKPLDLEGVQSAQARCRNALDTRRLYSAFAKHSGLSFGRCFQGVQAMQGGDAEGVALLQPPASTGRFLHSTVLDACFQTLAMLRGIDSDPFLPQAVEHVWVERPLPESATLCHVVIRTLSRDRVVGDCDFYTEGGERLGGVRGLHLKRARLSSRRAIQLFATDYLTKELVAPANSARVHVLGELEPHWPNSCALHEAEVVLDTRNTLEQASQLLSSVLSASEKPRLFFLYKENQSTWQPSPMLGMARAARNENPDLLVYACGVPASLEPAEVVASLPQLLTQSQNDEFEWVLREGMWEVPRLQAYELTHPPVDAADFRLVATRPGQLASLEWCPVRAGWEGLRPGELQIQVKSVSLHFKDVMLAMGMLGDFKPILGMECCGTVTAVGPGVSEEFPELEVGADVLCLSMTTEVGEPRSSLLGTTATVKARQAILRPPGLSVHEAAGFLGVTATAWHSLYNVGQVKAGEVVLIHSGAGGVGQAAIQIAKALGATVISSAGSEEKRNLLRQRFALDLVLDSHAPETFYDKVRLYTRGKGVDVVLNSLAGEGLMESLRCIGAGGRHLEIGKRDIFADRRLGLRIFKQNISFHSIQLDLLDQTHPERVRELLVDCVQRLHEGLLKPVRTRVFPAGEVQEAFRFMSSGKHTGKVAISFPENFVPTKKLSLPRPLFHAEETQLVTGGTRGLGLEFARFLADHGAEHIVLLGRSESVSQRTQVVLDTIRREHPHCHIRVESLDVRNKEGLRELFLSSEPPISGVFHAANLYATGTADSITENDIATYEVKVQGAVNLHEVSQGTSLRHFVLFSSLAGLHGNTRQAAYVSANAAMHQLAYQRKASGLPALAIDFPIVLGAGRLSEGKFVRELEWNTSRGFGALSFAAIEPHLLELLGQEPMPAHVSFDDPQWASYLQMQRYRNMYQHLIPQRVLQQSHVHASQSVSQTLMPRSSAPLDTPNAMPSVLPTPTVPTNASGDGAAVIARVAFLLGCQADDVERDVPLPQLGIDSLAAIELSEWLQHEFQVDISQTDILEGLSVQGVVKALSTRERDSEEIPAASTWSVERETTHEDATPAGFLEKVEVDEVSAQSVVLADVAARPMQRIQEAVMERVAFLLGGRKDEVETQMPLRDQGIDSLAAIELSEWLQMEYSLAVSQADLLGGWSIQDIFTHAEESSGDDALEVYTNLQAQSLEQALSTPSSLDSIPQSYPAAANFSDNSLQQEDGADTSRSYNAPTSAQLDADEGSVGLLVRTRQEGIEYTSEEWVNLPQGHPTPQGFVQLDSQKGLEPSMTEIEVSSTLDLESLKLLLHKVREARGVLVLREAPDDEHFCVGLNLKSMPFGSEGMNRGLALFAELYEALDAYANPIVVVVRGACRGGGMLFPLLGSVVLATHSSSFGFPEVRRGGLPGVVSVAAQRRMTRGHSQRYMMTGDVFSAERALQVGVVDFVGEPHEVTAELQRILGRFRTIEPAVLESVGALCPAPNLSQALLAMGSLGDLSQPIVHRNTSKVSVKLEKHSGVALLSLNDPLRSNAMGDAIGKDLKRAIAQLKNSEDVRAVIFHGLGEHFCVGVNPYQFVREVQQLPLYRAARKIYEIYRAFVGIRDLHVPVICVVHGKVVGGGLAAMLNADYRIAAADANFHYGNLPRGVCPGLLLSENLGRIVGDAAAMRLYLEDSSLFAEEARALGLVHDVFPDAENALEAAVVMARRLASASATGVQNTLNTMRKPIDEDRLVAESLGMARCLLEGEAFQGNWKEMPDSSPRSGKKESVVRDLRKRSDTPDLLSLNTVEILRCQGAKHTGILAMEIYTPGHCVRQEDLERQQAQPGKYTVGLGQEEIGFCGDDEDAVSMALTVVSRLMEKYDIDWHQIGRLEVGTESLTDRSKSIKTHLMSLFAEHNNFNIEGVDTYNACYGGTAALFNTVSWCQSDAWDGRYGLVVCVDIADLNEDQRFLNGAAAVAMLVGHDAALSLLPERASHMMNTWDFYKPVGWEDSYPLMRDGKHSIDVYMQSLNGCQSELSKKLHEQCILSSHDYFVFHCTSVYLCKRAFDQVVANSSLQGLSLKERQRLYEEKVLPGTMLTRRIGSSYTASCYVNLYSLLTLQQNSMLGKTICMYSYGSGSSSSMFRFLVRKLPKSDSHIFAELDGRHRHTPDEFVEIVDQYSGGYGRFDFVPAQRNDRRRGVFYLERVDEWGRRFYSRQD